MIVFLIKELRMIKKVTLEQLKEQTGISISYLSQIENNKVKNPSLLTIVKISEALNSKLNEVYFDENEINGLKRALNIYMEVYGKDCERTIKLSKKVNKKINEMK